MEDKKSNVKMVGPNSSGFQKSDPNECRPLEMSLSINFESTVLNSVQMYRLIEELRLHFRITNTSVISRFYSIFIKLDEYKYMQENVGLYKVALQFLFLLEKKFPALFTSEICIPVFLIIALMFTHKYFVDYPYDNKSIALMFQIPISKINEYEIKILQMLQYKLPFGFKSTELP